MIHGQEDTVVLLYHGFRSGRMWKHIYTKFAENGFKVVLSGRCDGGEDFFEFFAGDSFRSDSFKEMAALS